MTRSCDRPTIEPEIKLINNFVVDSDLLFNRLKNNVIWDERLKQRKTASYGVAYNYSGMTYPHTQMLAELNPICKRIETIIGFMPNNCLLNYYPDGKSTMSYHSDTAEELERGTGVCIVSLGASRFISYRSKSDRNIEHRYLLNGGDLLYMDNIVQKHWLHAIPKQDGVGARISLTFRRIISV